MTEWMLIFILCFAMLGAPLAISFGLGAVSAMLVAGKLPLLLAPIQIFSGLNSFLLIAVPFFILAGMLMSETDFADDIFRFANAVVGHFTGGLGHVNIVASLIFAGMSGSATADAGGLGRILINMMTKFGYPHGYSAALTAASAILATLVPPSIMGVLYGVAANQSIARVLLAGLLPGVLVGFLLMIYNYIISTHNGWGQSERFDFRQIARTFRRSSWALLTPVVLLGGIVSGWFTPTEAAAVAVFYVIIIDALVYRRLTWRGFAAVLIQTAHLTGSVLLILATASLVSFILTTEGIPLQLATLLHGVADEPLLLLLGIVVMLLIAGMFLDPVSGIIIFVPLFGPTVQGAGMDMVHFGVVTIAALAIGLVTPPVGPVLYVTSAVANVSLERLVIALLPLYAMLVLSLLIIAFVPQISLWVPNLLLG